MSKSITVFKQDIAGHLHGTTVNKVTNFEQLTFQAMREVITHANPRELSLEEDIANAVSSNVTLYTAPTKLFDNRVIDLYPTTIRQHDDVNRHLGNQDFETQKIANTFSVEYINGTKFLKINKEVGTSVLLHSMDSTTANGTLTEGGDVQSLARDNYNFIGGGASLKFTSTGATTEMTFTFTDMTSQDLSTYADNGSFFFWLYQATAKVTSIKYDWGNDSSNYYSDTVTTGHLKDLTTGWNMIRNDWAGSTETGSVDDTAIDYMKITLTYDGTADIQFRLDNILASFGTLYRVKYLSSYGFQNSSGTWIERPTDDSDLIMLDDSAYQLFIKQWRYLYTQQAKRSGKNQSDTTTLYGELFGTNSREGDYDNYRSEQGGLVEPESEIYHRF